MICVPYVPLPGQCRRYLECRTASRARLRVAEPARPAAAGLTGAAQPAPSATCCRQRGPHGSSGPLGAFRCNTAQLPRAGSAASRRRAARAQTGASRLAARAPGSTGLAFARSAAARSGWPSRACAGHAVLCGRNSPRVSVTCAASPTSRNTGHGQASSSGGARSRAPRHGATARAPRTSSGPRLAWR